jgi:SET domain-containing protein
MANGQLGVRCRTKIAAGDFVCEYLGQYIDEDGKRQRIRQNIETHQMSYVFQVAQGKYLDAAEFGNLARFINHSCEPNCIAEVWRVRGLDRVAIVASRLITIGEPITIAYGPPTK